MKKMIPVEMMVLKQFSNRRLDELLMNLRKAGVPRIAEGGADRA